MQKQSSNPYASIMFLSESFERQTLMPSDVVKSQLERIANLDRKLGSYQAIYESDALEAAKAADAAIASGHRIGPFHGVPFALKDIFDVGGRVTACGSKAMRNRIPSHSGTIVRRLIAAGGILLGKTKTVECALGGWGTNQYMGTPWNPWDLEHARVPGGSSSGSGVAVASGLAMCATGTDTGGSVRLPAAYCGLVGLKVSKACLPTKGILPLSSTLDTPGPMARSIADVTLMFEIMRGTEGWIIDRDKQQKSGLFDFTIPTMSGLRLGILDDHERQLCSADILNTYDAAVDIFASLGAHISVFSSPTPYAEMASANGAITIFEGYHNHHALYEIIENQMDEDVRKRILSGREMTDKSHAKHLHARAVAQEIFCKTIQEFDALLTPTITRAAPLLTEIDQNISPGHFTRPFNYLDMCALAMPLSLTPHGLPTSLQIITREGQEALALRIGATLESVLGITKNPDLSRFDYLGTQGPKTARQNIKQQP